MSWTSKSGPSRQSAQSGHNISPSGTSSLSAAGGGIFDGGFETYRTVTPDSYRSLLTSGLVVLDANVLLSLYRYRSKTRDDLIEIFKLIRERLWVPHHAMSEFWQRRLSVIDDHSTEIQDIVDGINKSRVQLEELVNKWANRVGLSAGEVHEATTTMVSATEEIIKKIQNISSDNAFIDVDDTSRDPVVSALSAVLSQNIGFPLPAEDLRKVKAEALQRIADKRPPGYKDANKRENKEGDYIVWYQTLLEAKNRNVDVLFVTGDVKEDWWRKEQGEVKGPLPELVYETQVYAGVRLFMLRPGSLLLHARRIFGLDISDESVEDAQRVSSQLDIKWRRGPDEIRSLAYKIRHDMRMLARPTGELLQPLLTSVNDLITILEIPDSEFLDYALRVIQESREVGWLLLEKDASPYPRQIIENTQLLRTAVRAGESLDMFYMETVSLWLADVADKAVSEGMQEPSEFHYSGRFPPLVTDLEVYSTEELRNAYKVTFRVVTIDGQRVFSVNKIVPKRHDSDVHTSE